MAKGGEFERILLKTINDVLLEIFGENATSIIYGYIEKNYSLTQQNIAHNLQTFIRGLNEFLGSGARMVQIMILKELYSNFGFELEQIDDRRSFADYINELKYKLETSIRTGYSLGKSDNAYQH